ncbi:MAG: hypothetical protein O9305_15755, partial [Rhodobacteraceae bacterium]|nr:hypothetical protein [Paracoccaceae bacterium]
GLLGFTVDDVAVPAGSLVVVGGHDNPALLGGGSITLGGSGANRTVSVTPLANAFGSATITLTVDNGFTTSTTTFTLTVAAVNDRPLASGTATLPAVLEDTTAPPGAQVSTLFGGSYSDATDGSAATALAGVAIVGNASSAGQGAWQYSADGSTGWTDVPTSGLSDAAALVLPASYWLRFVPSADWNGTPGALSARLADSSGGALTLASAADLSAALGPAGAWSAATVGVATTITAAPDEPVLTLSVTTRAYLEGQAPVVLDSGLTVADADSVLLASATVAITGGFTLGDTLNATPLGGIAMNYDAAAGVLTFTGPASLAAYEATLRSVTYRFIGDHPESVGVTRTLSWTVGDGALGSAVRTSAVQVTDVNDAPAGANRTITTSEDVARTLTLADFGFVDVDGDAFLGLVLSNRLGAGSITLDGMAVVNGQSISSADIAAGKLVFTPALNASGANYASFDFRVFDDGGVANGGANTDPTPNTLRFDVTAVNDVPTITPIANQTIAEDGATGPLAFTVGDVETAPGTLTVSASSTNTALAPVASIVLGGSGASRTVTVTPLANAFGSATITLT